jgi:protein-tyrosine phosphatase
MRISDFVIRHSVDGGFMPTILFLCTGNYYRSRFAEMLFNHLAEVHGISWRAESRGIATETNYLLPGVISPLTCEALRVRGVPMPQVHRDAIQCLEEDFSRFDRVIAVKETEHRPMMRRRFGRFADDIEYWEIDDISHGPTETAITELDRRVRRLIQELSAQSE